VIYKPALVSCFSCLVQQQQLQGGEGAGGVKELDGQAPYGGRDVWEGYPSPSPYHKPPADYEDDEAEVKHKNQISE
jgi:hypothetical protein